MRASRTTLTWVLVYAVAAGVLGAGALAARDARTDDPVEATPPALAPEPFAVTLSAAAPGSSVLVGSTVLLGAQALTTGAPVRALELWDGGQRVEQAPLRPGRRGASFSWPALTTGPHLLHARAIDADGRVARSAPVALQVGARAVASPLVPVAVHRGETVRGLPVRLGVDPSRVVVRLPGRAAPVRLASLPPTTPLPPGSQVQVDVDVFSVEATEAVVQPPYDPAVAVQPLPLPGELPAPPVPVPAEDPDPLTLVLDVDDCAVGLLVAGAEDAAVSVERASAGTPGFVTAGKTDGDGIVRVKDLGPGTHVFTARSAGEVSAPVSVTLPASCAASLGWTGDVSLVNGVAKLPRGGSQVYLFVGVDDRPFVRVPAEDDAFLAAPLPTLDVSSRLPELGSGKRVVVEAWERAGGEAVRMGTGRLDLPSEQAISSVVGEPTAVTLTVDAGQGPVRSAAAGRTGALPFTWTAAGPRVVGVVWQVLSVPLTPANTDLAPFGVVATGVSKSTTGTGTFTIDAATLAQGPLADAPGAAPASPAAVTVAAPDLTGAVASLPGGVPAVLGSGAVPGAVAKALAELAAAPTGQVFVRVLPLQQPPGQATPTSAGTASELVTLALPGPVPPPIIRKGPRLSLVGVSVDAGNAANPKYASCLRVLSVPWSRSLALPSSITTAADKQLAKNPSAVAMSAFYPTPRTYCAAEFAPKPCDDLVCVVSDAISAGLEALADVWDVIAAAYNGVIEGLVSVLAKFNPVCLAASAASEEAGASCADVASVVAGAVVTAALASFGLPPSLPTSGELLAVASGDLSALAVAIMEQLGVPCSKLALDPDTAAAVTAGAQEAGVKAPTNATDPCRLAADLLVAQVTSQAKEIAQDSAAHAAGLPYLPVPGFSIESDPRGRLQPTEVRITATGVPGEALPPAGFTCPVDVATTNPGTGTVVPWLPASGALTRDPGSETAWSADVVLAFPRPNLDLSSVPPLFRLDAAVTSQAGCLVGLPATAFDLVGYSP